MPAGAAGRGDEVRWALYGVRGCSMRPSAGPLLGQPVRIADSVQ